MSIQEQTRERDRRCLLLAALADVTPRTAARFLDGLDIHRKNRDVLSIALPEARRIRPQWYPEKAVTS
jgi:hypothetical protein